MKKILAVLCAVCIVFALGATAFAAEYNVGVCQLVQHPALDAATQGFIDALTEKAGEGVVDVNWQNGSGDSATCSVIVNQFVSDEVDLIMANATPALVAAGGATSTIPILGTSITAYAAAFEIEEDWADRSFALNVSGTSDLAPLDEQAAMLNAFFPEAKNVGILYCSGEPNSKFQVETITPILEGFGYTVNLYSFADSNEVTSMTMTAVEENDVLYIPTDNTAASCAEAINNIALPAGVPIIAGESGLCKGCGVATLSIDYYELGRATGEMAYEILVNGADVSTMEIQYSPEFTKMYNPVICEALGIEVPEDYVAIDMD